MRSIRAVVFGFTILLTAIMLTVGSLAILLTHRVNTTIEQARTREALADRAQDVVFHMTTARRLENDYFFAINNGNLNISRQQTSQEWHTAYDQLGEKLQALKPLMPVSEQQQFEDWNDQYVLYGQAFALIEQQYNKPTSTPQEAKDAMNAFNQPLNTWLTSTLQFAQTQRVQSERSWSDAQHTRTNVIMLLSGIVALAIMISFGAAAFMPRLLVAPLGALTTQAERIAQGDYSGRVEQTQITELGRLAHAVNDMTEQLAIQHATVMARTAELEQASVQQQALVDELQASLHERETLSATIRDLSVPVLPVLPGVIVVPLVGEFDPIRAAELQEIVLTATEAERAHHVLIDVTGVPTLDPNVAQTLIQLTDAIRLLGARPTLIGVRPEVAQTLVQSGISFKQLDIQPDLQCAVVSHTTSTSATRGTRTINAALN